MSPILNEVQREFKRHKELAEKALASMTDDAFFQKPGEEVNPPALIVKHLAGNLSSRWTDFLTTDGEKPTRNRDQEFILNEADSRAHLLLAWEKGWEITFAALQNLTEADLAKTVTIRGEPFTVLQAVLRSLTHTIYHVGQIMYLTRLLQPGSKWLTIAPGQSQGLVGNYLGMRPPAV